MLKSAFKKGLNMDQQTAADIELLLNVVRPKIESADKVGASELFREIGEEFGSIAHRVYRALDLPVRTPENYHNRSMTRVLLDPFTVLNRSHSLGVMDEVAIDKPEFWDHADMIKTLIDFLSLIQSKKEVVHE